MYVTVSSVSCLLLCRSPTSQKFNMQLHVPFFTFLSTALFPIISNHLIQSALPNQASFKPVQNKQDKKSD